MSDIPSDIPKLNRQVHGAVQQILYNELGLNGGSIQDRVDEAVARYLNQHRAYQSARDQLSSIAARLELKERQIDARLKELCSDAWLTEKVSSIVESIPAMKSLRGEARRVMEERAIAEVRSFVDANFKVEAKPVPTRRIILPPTTP